ncbi:NADH-quinone oxidoreductase subunit C [Bradymonas sediminis]|uniref:NADH-quinone oxidoreductase subunit C n=1 Tax=Bradymonas sediminis TaxID=1548548 RepID=A0A2Z4FR42_9DELT|nr:NADH-quinone oxidoreductase subunit C [Bradymonas sediminis]AWV91392.1 NADH-quinone oxidoreductase subunit C [Bradymonas sediminis]TDP76796.1 NADH dehydrogenase subunit C [Bradymonas sediminis]
MAKKLIALVERKFSDAVLDVHSRLGQDTVTVEAEFLPAIIQYLRDDESAKMDFLRLVTGVDYLTRTPRFDVVYVLYSTTHKHMLTVRVPLPADNPKVGSIHELYQCAGWFEREVWDFYGIDFEGHPDMRRVLNYEEFEGHPLRKDYDKQRAQPRIDLLDRERDSVEEFYEYSKKHPAAGSRES